MKKIVSLALFGSGNIYARYFGAFARAHLNLFPIAEGWKLRVHCDGAVKSGRYGRVLDRFAGDGLVEISHMLAQPPVLTKAMLWRLDPVFDSTVDYVFARDLDACPMPRDRAVCDQFILSQAVVHTVHDNLQHTGIMGGLCGFHAPAYRAATGFKSLDDLYRAANLTDEQWALHGMDQIALNTLQVRGPLLLEHRFGGWMQGAPTGAIREASEYHCSAWSAPVPDVGVSRFVGELAARADRLANHMGAAGYDRETAVKFYDEYGDPEIAARVAACEKE